MRIRKSTKRYKCAIVLSGILDQVFLLNTAHKVYRLYTNLPKNKFIYRYRVPANYRD